MAIWSEATFRPITSNFNVGRISSSLNGLILHITDGHAPGKGRLKVPPTLEGLLGTFNNPSHKASAHFGVNKDGEIWQFIDTANRAWSVDGDTIDGHWASIENIAVPGDELTDAQVDVIVRLLQWLNVQHGVPLSVARTKASTGLGYHALFGKGHPGCPGSPVIAQIEDIVALANGIEPTWLQD
jgi:N-acetylmuramoyl-L-alanine amidase